MIKVKALQAVVWSLVLACGVALAAGSATDLIRNTANDMLAALERNRSELDQNPSKIYGIVDKILLPHFDFERITRAAVGRSGWNDASPSQRDQLVSGFRELLTRTYAKTLLEYSGETISYLSEEPGSRPDTASVATAINQPGADSIRIDYRLHTLDGPWKVYDVIIDDVSLVRNYQGSFAAEIRRSGIDGLIKSIADLNAKASG